MKRSFALVSLFVAAAACADGGGPLSPVREPASARSAGAGDRYVVVLKDGENPRAVAALLGINPSHVYTASLQGFAAALNQGQLNALRHNPAVAYVEPDAPARLFTTQYFPGWGLDRIDQHPLPLNYGFAYTSKGTGVTVYVLDTGIRKTHDQFDGVLGISRANYIANGASGDFVGDGHGSAEDCHGHGTHVAGIVGGTTYGVAKNVQIRAGRVVDCAGNGTTSMVISGMDWIIANGVKPAVVNMSLGYGDVQSVRDMVGRLTYKGFVVVAAAGNGNFAGTPQDACLQSPAGAPTAITVGATTSTDKEATFSNYGTCVDILAPGVSIRSAWVGSDSANALDSGTSMAAPFVSGVAAQYLQGNTTATPATVWNFININATLGVLTMHSLSASNGTPNKLLYTNF
ncbi:MAG TPA: S8 family peptidase [Longimicrobium sp.]|nr:S8 family peptidase [Longimicrobium sp.]